MLGDLVFSIEGGRVMVDVALGSTTLLSETYYPVSGVVAVRDLAAIVTPSLRPLLTATLSITLTEQTYSSQTSTWTNGTPVSVTSAVTLCDAELDATPTIYLAANFATMLRGPKRTTLDRKENIWYWNNSANDSITPTVVGQYYDGSTITTYTFTLTAQTGVGYHEVDCSAANYTRTGKILLRYYVQVGTRRQTFVIDHAAVDGSPALVFKNAFGLDECIYCRGTETTRHDYDRLSATVFGNLRNHRIDETVLHHADTGPLNEEERVWATELFRSTDVSLLKAGTKWKAVVITGSDVERDDGNTDLTRYRFDYRLSQRNHHIATAPTATSIFDATFDQTFN